MPDVPLTEYALLRQDSAFQDFVYAHAVDGIWMWDLQSPERSFRNERLGLLLGYTPEKWVQQGSDWREHLLPDDRVHAESELDRHLRDPSHPFDVLLRFYHLRGHVVWIRCQGYAVRDERGTPIRLQGVFRDKTALKRSEETLTQCNQAAQLGLWEHDFQSEFVTLSPIARALLDLPDDLSVTQEQIYSFITNEVERQTMRERMLSAVKEGASFDEELQLRTYTGRPIHIRIVGLAERHNGWCIRLFGTIRDITVRKTAESSVRMSEQLFRVAFEHAPIGMALVSPTGHILRVNDALCRILGYTAEELKQLTFHPITHPDDLGADLALVQMIFDGQREGYEMEKRYIRKDGRLVHALLAVSAVRSDSGKILHFISQVQDITDRVLARTRLERSNRLLNEAQRIGKMGAWELDVDSGQIFWSDQVYAIHEVDKDSFDLYTEDGIAFYHPEDQPRIRAAISAAIQDQKPYDLTSRFLTAKRRSLWVRATGFPIIEGGRVVRLTGMFQDITEQEEQKFAREREQEFSRLLVEHMAEGLTILDGQGVQIGVNPALCAMTGFTEEELLGCTAPYPYWPEEELGNIEAAFTQALAQKGGQFELILNRKDGTRFPVLLNASTILDDAGNIRYHFANLTDLTSIQEARREREDLARFNQLMLEQIPGYIFVKDDQFRIIAANEAFLSLYPKEMRDSVIGSTTLEAYSEAEREVFLAEDRKALAEGQTEIKEVVTFPNGERKTLLTRKVCFEDGNGAPHILGLAIDISELEEAQSALKDALARINAIVNASDEVSVIGTDLEGNITFFSSGAEHLLGYTDDEVVGQHTPLLFHVAEELRDAHAALEAELGHPAPLFDAFVHHARQGRTVSHE